MHEVVGLFNSVSMHQIGGSGAECILDYLTTTRAYPDMVASSGRGRHALLFSRARCGSAEARVISDTREIATRMT